MIGHLAQQSHFCYDSARAAGAGRQLLPATRGTTAQQLAVQKPPPSRSAPFAPSSPSSSGSPRTSSTCKQIHKLSGPATRRGPQQAAAQTCKARHLLAWRSWQGLPHAASFTARTTAQRLQSERGTGSTLTNVVPLRSESSPSSSMSSIEMPRAPGPANVTAKPTASQHDGQRCAWITALLGRKGGANQRGQSSRPGCPAVQCSALSLSSMSSRQGSTHLSARA